jgi:hypothetical protein
VARAAKAEAHRQAQLAALLAATHTGTAQTAWSAVGTYRVGVAQASNIPVFTGDSATDCGKYLQTLECLFKAHEIPLSYWSTELFLKLAG